MGGKGHTFYDCKINLLCIQVFSFQLDGHELKGKKLQVNISIPNTRLFIGNIPKSKDKEEILSEFNKHIGKFKKKHCTRPLRVY